MLHAKRTENPLLENVAIKLAAHLANENAQSHVAEIAVVPLFTGSESERLGRDHLQQVVLGVILLHGKIFGIIAESRGVREQMPHA